jgi:two-component system sensor kinase FixL
LWQEDRAIEPHLAAPTVSEARLSSVLDTAAEGIIIIDERARVLMFNKACEWLFGYTAADVLGTDVRSILPPENAEKQGYSILDSSRGSVREIAGVGQEVTGRHRDGTIFPIELSVGEAMTPDGRQFIGILRDLRSRRESEQRLNQLQADLLRMARVSAMDQMGAALAHELNQPLTALMLYLQAVDRTGEQSAGGALSRPAVEILEKAMHEAERAGNIIQRMRRFVEKRDPVRRLMNITYLVDDAVELTLLGNRPGTKITRELTQNLPPVLVDPVQIQQVVVNLVRNALDAVKEHAEPDVRICTRKADDTVMLKVEDNGPGIPPTALPSLFKAFSSSKGSGLGLGLIISRTIAQNHGGDLTVEPGGNGKGASFTLHLPVHAQISAPLLMAG